MIVKNGIAKYKELRGLPIFSLVDLNINRYAKDEQERNSELVS